MKVCGVVCPKATRYSLVHEIQAHRSPCDVGPLSFVRRLFSHTGRRTCHLLSLESCRADVFTIEYMADAPDEFGCEAGAGL